ncbi:sulfatase family protein [Seonamhaeicola maritimus]|uniref:Arylsulfatase n=1 Tax=Seonamhaeicola maritimus TaxID=2591822 RepID=A0A5C7GFY2_9FLAO|nr:arylsulfatase [Seonamhaeicola maritimus]TXG36109.1 arylsulfatase [Seonamhaeicola maritimus]
MKLKIDFSTLLFALMIGGCINAQNATKAKPNIIVVLADDVGVGDISKYRRLHNPKIIIETPNIDKLAENGMMFTNAHAPASLCATSRYSIMTGNYNYRSPLPWGVWGGYSKGVFTEESLTLGRLMKKANYNTAFIGKWHLGTGFSDKRNPNKTYDAKSDKDKFNIDVDITKIVSDGPKQNGFDYSFNLPSGIQNVPYAAYENNEWYPLNKHSLIGIIDKEYAKKHDFTFNKKEGYGDSMWQPSEIGPLIANKAVSYIRENANKIKPFFMYYCSQAVHSPHAAPEELDGIKIKGTTPSKHLDMVKELDVQMKMLVDELKHQGVYENTVFIFTSDNGGLHVDADTWDARHEPSDIYRGCKNDPYEGGSRVPFIVSWPNKIKGQTKSNVPVLGTDIMATIAAISETKIDKGGALDSYNLLPFLNQERGAKSRSHIMLQGGSQKEVMIIEDGWKLIIQVDKKDKTNKARTPIALFDLNKNIWEHEEFNYINNPKYKSKVKNLLNLYNETRDGAIPTGSHF